VVGLFFKYTELVAEFVRVLLGDLCVNEESEETFKGLLKMQS